ncbi:MAG TPA: M48 family metalloprotease [Pyrinomonadaceae bacterium]
MFEFLGISLLLAGLLAFNSFASVVTSGLWRVCLPLTSRWPAHTRARLIFLLRILPALLAIFCGAFLLAPAYLTFEPRHTDETVSLKLGVLALLSAIGIGFAIFRSIAAWRATARLTADWLRAAEPIRIDNVKITTFRIDHAFPVIAIVGVLRPRLFIANQVLEILSDEEIEAAIAHENGHLRARDNLKRGLMRACRDALLILPTGRSLDNEWSEAAEEAADEHAAQKGFGVALDLASALVKIARNIPKGARPTMPAGVFLIGDQNTGIKWRVGRLVDLSQRCHQPEMLSSSFVSWLIWIAFITSLSALAVIFNSQTVLASVHALIEQAVSFLR